MVLPPFTKLKLLKRNRNAPYFHIDTMYTEQVTTRYEFELVELAEPKIPQVTKAYIQPATTNLLSSRIEGDELSVLERVHKFHETVLDRLGQMRIDIGDHRFIIMTEWYNSTASYKEFYSHLNRKGFSMYGFSEADPERILFFIEVVTDLHELHVNWYFKWSDDSHLFSLITEADFLMFLAKLAYAFSIQRVLIYGRYRFCHTLGGDCAAGSYRADIYEYLKHGHKRFPDNDDVTAQFSYVQLDTWKTTPASEVIRASDRDQFYQQVMELPTMTVAELYTDTVERHCSQIGVLESKIGRMYKGTNSGFNPLEQIFWVLEPYELLHRHRIIATIPDDDPEIVPIIQPVTVNIQEEGTRMNRYRMG